MIERWWTTVGVLALATLSGSACMARSPASAPVQQSQHSILVSSNPPAGARVAGPVHELRLRFNPPARLDEVTVSGPDGVMPMMLHPLGDVADYTLPLTGVEAGSYTVSWRATAQGREYRGRFQFRVRS